MNRRLSDLGDTERDGASLEMAMEPPAVGLVTGVEVAVHYTRAGQYFIKSLAVDRRTEWVQSTVVTDSLVETVHRRCRTYEVVLQVLSP